MVAWLACLTAPVTQAAIGVGVTNTFDALPAVVDWSTLLIAGGSGTPNPTNAASLDAAVQTNIASVINVPLASSNGLPPNADSIAVWSSEGHYVMTRPTAVAYELLMATVENTTANNLSTVLVSYNLTVQAPVVEEVRGHLAYFSLTGEANSWQPIPELSGTNTGVRAATITLGSWPTGSLLYILWADDNGSGTPDTALEIDNFVVTSPSTVPVPVITQQPVNTTNIEDRAVSLSVVATGPGLQFQWYKDGAPIDPAVNPTATQATLVITNATTSDTGNYFVTVDNPNPAPAITSTTAHLEIKPDTTPPSFVFAAGDASDLTVINLTVDELLCTDFSVCGSDATSAFGWHVADKDTGAELGVRFDGVSINGTNITLGTTDPRVPGRTYRVFVEDLAVCDRHQNCIPSTASIELSPSVSFQQGVNGYTGTHDTELRQAAADTPQFANTFVTVDNDDPPGTGQIAEGLLRFENIFGSGADQVPLGANIISASLTLTHGNGPTPDGDPVNLYRMLIPWDESTATYNSFVNGVQADDTEARSTSDLTIISAGIAVGAKLTFDLRASVQAWANGEANFGWAFIQNLPGGNGYRWDTSESTVVGSQPRLSIVYNVPQCTAPPSFTRQPPPSVSVNEGGTLTLSAGVSACAAAFQWTKGGTDIPGANNISYITNNVTLAAAGQYRLRVTNPNGNALSDASTVTVAADTVRPILSRAVADLSGTTITLTFSKVMNSASAQNTGNYTLTPSLAVNSAVLSANGQTVTVTTATRTFPTAYTLRIAGVTDNRSSMNHIDPDPTLVALTGVQVIEPFDAANWLYSTNNQDATLSGTPWYAPSFVPGADWFTGQALFGIETDAGTRAGLPAPIVTPLIPNTNTASPDLVTTYFRRSVTLPSLPAGARYAISHAIDDGAVFYLDGVEFARYNMTNGPVVYSTKAAAAIETSLQSFYFTASAGAHTLAVEVHQGGATTSSDVVFGLSIRMLPATAPSLAIRHDLAANTNHITWNADASWELSGSANVAGPYAPLAGLPFSPFSFAVSTNATNHFYLLQYTGRP